MRYGIFVIGFFTLQAIMLAVPGQIGITMHEGDLMHMVDAALRMADGEIPHRDFMTPLGILAIAPMALFLALGFAGGKAAVLSNLLVAGALVLPTIWVGYARLSGWFRYAFGAAIVIITVALVHGGADNATSLSMFYNRWSWAIVFLILVAILWPAPNAERAWKLGLLVGGGLSLLALIKMTFFVAFALPVGLILLVQRRYRVLLGSVVIGAAVIVATSVALGFDFWLRYALDLLSVTLNSDRQAPGESFFVILGAPRFAAGSLSLVAAIIYFRKTGSAQMGLFLLLLWPGFMLATWQNWGNDPKWLILIPLLVFAHLGTTQKAREWGLAISVTATVAIMPSMITLSLSGIRHMGADLTAFSPIQQTGILQDIWIKTTRIQDIDVLRPMDGVPPTDPLRVFAGVTLQDCRLVDGIVHSAEIYADTLVALPNDQPRHVLMADLLNILPLISDLPRLAGGAPWYYGGDPGFDAADTLALPKCPLNESARDFALDALERKDWTYQLIQETDQMWVFAITRPIAPS